MNRAFDRAQYAYDHAEPDYDVDLVEERVEQLFWDEGAIHTAFNEGLSLDDQTVKLIATWHDKLDAKPIMQGILAALRKPLRFMAEEELL